MLVILSKFYKKNKLLFIFLISSLIISSINLEVQKKFLGQYLFNDDGSTYHGFLRYPPEKRIWQEAYEIKEMGVGIVKNKEFAYHFLPSINLGVIGKLFDLNFFTSNNQIDLTGINYFFIFQIIILKNYQNLLIFQINQFMLQKTFLIIVLLLGKMIHLNLIIPVIKIMF